MDQKNADRLSLRSPVDGALERLALGNIARGGVLSQDRMGSVKQVRDLAHPKQFQYLLLDSADCLLKDEGSRQKNLYACLPTLRQAVEASGEQTLAGREARTEYEQRRLLRWDLAPKYAQRLMQEKCARLIKSIDITRATEGASKAVRDSIRAEIKGMFTDRPESLVRYTGIHASLSHDDAMRLLPEVTRPFYSDQISFQVLAVKMPGAPARSSALSKGHSQQGEVEGWKLDLQERFTPWWDGPFGKAAAEAWKMVADLGLSTLILEDLLHELPFKVPEMAKAQALEKVREPWDIVDSPLIRNAQAIEELWEAGSLDTEDVERLLKKPARLLDRKFESELIEICAAVARKRSRSQQPAHAGKVELKPFSADFVNSERPLWHGNPKKEFRFGLSSVAPAGEVGTKAFEEKLDALYERYKRTDLTWSECLEIVRAGGSIESAERAASQRPESRGLRFPSFRPFRRREAPRTAVEESNTPERERPEKYTIHGMDTDWFKKWLAGLSKNEQDRVKTRLACAAEGRFRDYTQLRGAGKLWEFRFQDKAGQRLYFQFEGDGVIRLKGAGKKDDQKIIIDRLRGEMG